MSFYPARKEISCGENAQNISKQGVGFDLSPIKEIAHQNKKTCGDNDR
jgi:hypothetical protein